MAYISQPKLLGFVVLFLSIVACQSNSQETVRTDTLFKKLDASTTGINFSNQLRFDERFNVFQYRNYYNGGGVAIGDLNNDGLEDIFFSANDGPNHLYLNKGEWFFEEVAEQAGVQGKRAWSTGVAFADVNADGWLDIYLCNSGNINGDDKQNELYINNQDGTFSEQATKYGLADEGYGTHAVFFDYDRDGDLDCYLLNNSFRPIDSFGYRNLRNERDELGGDKLYRNNGEQFVDVSEQAGILGSVIGFGLGVTVGDVNGDNWPDIYVSNDFFERDYLYINQQDGRFKEELTESMGHISLSSMGADMADLDNDGYPEIFVTDMLPKEDKRLKQTSTFESYNVFQTKLNQGYYHQYMRNMLHWNQGDGTFSETAQLSGVDATDWSWGALLADFDQDGLRDIIVSNGIFKDVTDQDFINYLAANETMQAALQGERVNFKDFVDRMPSTPIPNAAFRNNGKLKFTDVALEWGLNEASFSNGAAYGDLDNDGDLDLVINNVNKEAFVYENTTQTHRYIGFQLKGEANNPFAVGTKLRLYQNDSLIQYYDHMPMRGFQSSMGYGVRLGVGNRQSVDVEIEWPTGQWTSFNALTTDSTYTISFERAEKKAFNERSTESQTPLFSAFYGPIAPSHKENTFVDFNRNHLLYRMRSRNGPAVAENEQFLFVGGAKGELPQMFQKNNNKLMWSNQDDFKFDDEFEDVAAVFADVDQDGDDDLYVVSGGSENRMNASSSIDRLYIFEDGRFVRSADRLPYLYESSSTIVASDFDTDGDIDFLIGSDYNVAFPGMPTDAIYLQNDGKGYFSSLDLKEHPALQQLGIVNEFTLFDYDRDGDQDVLVASDWMPVRVLRNEKGVFKSVKDIYPTKKGWWQHVQIADIDNDGDEDIIAGNWGFNTKFEATEKQAVVLYNGDLDQNGTVDPIFAFTDEKGLERPFALRHDLMKQLNFLSKRFVYYKEYGSASLDEIFNQGELNRMKRFEVTELAHGIFWNESDTAWTWKELPTQTQISPIQHVVVFDANEDGKKDLMLVGNFEGTKPEEGRYDANYGQILLQKEQQNWRYLPKRETGLDLRGVVKRVIQMDDRWLFIKNNAEAVWYQKNE